MSFMDLSGDEKRIEQLFREMRLEDQVLMPRLESVLGSTRTTPRLRMWPLAIAGGLAILVLAVIVGLLNLGTAARRKASDESAISAPPSVQEVTPKEALFEKPRVVKRTIGRRRRHRRPGRDQLAIAIRTLSTWRSPTASLMKYPGEDMLKSLPRLGESLETIKSFSTEQFN